MDVKPDLDQPYNDCAYRRGAHQAVDQAVDALQRGATNEDVLRYCNAIQDWRNNGDTTAMEPLPLCQIQETDASRLRGALQCAKAVLDDIERRVFTSEEKPRAATFEECRKIGGDAMCAAGSIQHALGGDPDDVAF